MTILNDIHAYYNKNLKNKNIQKARKITDATDTLIRKTHGFTSDVLKLRNDAAIINTICKQFDINKSEYKDAIAITNSWETYSDWHKELYGYRP